jgi:hypothetical protein
LIRRLEVNFLQILPSAKSNWQEKPSYEALSTAVYCTVKPPYGSDRERNRKEGNKNNGTMTTVEQITAVATGLGWQVSTNRHENVVAFDFQRYTDKGQDFNVCIEMKDDDFDNFLHELEQYYESFDPDYEAYLWIGSDGHGKNGAPYHIKDIVSDMEEAEKTIEKLYETLKTIE